MELKVNTLAPFFCLLSTNNKEYCLKHSKGKIVILYFYPKDDTPGCTLETKNFNSLLSKFKKFNCEVYGISKDNIESHHKFKKKYNVKLDLLADDKKKVIKAYKVWGKKKFMGKEFMGIIRSTFLINEQKKIIKIWKNVKVKDHAQEVLDAVKSLQN